MNSFYFEELKSRINKLKKVFLPRALSPTGKYKPSTYEKARAFKTFTHTEIEIYLENICFGIAKKAYDEWQNSKVVSLPLLAMLAYYSGKFRSIPELKSGNNSEEDLSEKIHIAFTDYSSKKANNNGIKEKDILQLVLPIGVQTEDINDDLLLYLNNYGSIRGAAVHSVSALHPITPEDALASTDDLMKKLSELDKKLIIML